MAPRFRATFQTTFFLSAVSAALIALAVAGAIFATTMRRQLDARIEQTLVAETRLAADLLSHGTPVATIPELDEEADRIGALIAARVTFIAPDGRVLGDSAETLDGVRAMENHGQRPEIVQARAEGLGRARRRSDTLRIDMLYAAVPVQHPAIGYVRVALPLTDVGHQLQAVLVATLAALGLALVGGVAIAWLFSARISRRVRLIAGIAERYTRGDLSPLPWMMTLPSITAAHMERDKKLTPEAMADVISYTRGEYATTLLKGRSDADAEKRMIQRVTEMTGLDPQFVKYSGARIDTEAYLREVHREEGKLGSVYDSNVTSFDPFPFAPEQRANDPILASIM